MQLIGPIRVQLASYKDKIIVANLADMHVGSAGVDYRLLRRDIQFIAHTPNAYAIIVGDMAQLIGHLDPRFRPGDADEASIKRAGGIWQWQCKQAAQELKPIKSKILAIAPGNHEDSVAKFNAFRVGYQVASELGLDMRRVSGGDDLTREASWLVIARLIIATPKREVSRAQTFICDITCHHGYGAARTEGALQMQLVRTMNDWPYSDAYFMGHAHTKGYQVMAAVKPNSTFTGTQQVERVGVRSGTYDRSYILGQCSYAERGCFKPASLGCNGIQIRARPVEPKKQAPRRLFVKYWEPDMEPDIDSYKPEEMA